MNPQRHRKGSQRGFLKSIDFQKQKNGNLGAPGKTVESPDGYNLFEFFALRVTPPAHPKPDLSKQNASPRAGGSLLKNR